MYCVDCVLQGDMIGKGTFQELSKSGVDFSSLLKHEEEDQDKTPCTVVPATRPHPVQRSTSHDVHKHRSHDLNSKSHDLYSKSHDHLERHLSSETAARLRLDSRSMTSLHDSVAGSMMSINDVGIEFEVGLFLVCVYICLIVTLTN